MKNNLSNLLSIALTASIEAGIEIMSIYDTDIKIEYKDDESPLTIADKKANDIIIKHLEKTDVNIISEENKVISYQERKKWNTCWIVDPLDGTKEFIKRNGEFTVNIALINNNKPILGVIYIPVTKEIYFGNVIENTAFKYIVNDLTSIDNIFKNAIQIFPKESETKLRVVGSRSHMNEQTKKYLNLLKNNKKEIEIISKGSSLKFCLIAEGKADIYPRFAPTMEWDTAAGQAICEAVNIQVISKETEKPLLYNKENLLNPYFIVQ